MVRPKVKVPPVLGKGPKSMEVGFFLFRRAVPTLEGPMVRLRILRGGQWPPLRLPPRVPFHRPEGPERDRRRGKDDELEKERPFVIWHKEEWTDWTMPPDGPDMGGGPPNGPGTGEGAIKPAPTGSGGSLRRVPKPAYEREYVNLRRG